METQPMSGYEQALYRRVVDKLKERGFERRELYSWVFTFPDGKRMIQVEFDKPTMATVKFDSEILYQSPFSLMECLDAFNK